MAAAEEGRLVCLKCDCLLEYENTSLSYLGHKLSDRFLKCPKCKQVYIPEEAAIGRMAKVEESLEDK
ncbi:MAG: hypothetical protein FWF83_04740 [Clostridiales bacterium]|nr:hypothetical protein [Clostridiales bacterium]